MTDEKFPALDAKAILPTRDALHAYARVMGAWAVAGRKPRKHWWQGSLRPSLSGLTTGVVYGAADYEIELDFVASRLVVRAAAQEIEVELHGQPSQVVAQGIGETLAKFGVDKRQVPADDKGSDTAYADYSPRDAEQLHRAFASVAAALEDLRAGVHEETSPIQVWPHHFDIAMLWLPGRKISGEDPADEEASDKQMNFGFVFGDEGIAAPYFYITAYPLPDALPKTELPEGTAWQSEGFSGAVALYADVAAKPDPHAYLLDVWGRLLAAGREHVAVDD